MRSIGQSGHEYKARTPHPLPRFTTTEDAYAHQLYWEEVQDRDVVAFLEASGLYDTPKKRWCIPTTSASSQDLVPFVLRIIWSVVDTLVRPAHPGVKREAVATNRAGELHMVNGPQVLPHIVVRGVGPSFEAPSATGSDLGFGNIATYFSVKLNSELGDSAGILDEMAACARRIFRLQPNRVHVRSLVITENHAKLIHFDRAGTQVTPPIDIHTHPKTFVRLLAGMTSKNERTLGFDDRFQWEIINGRKAQGTLTTISANGVRKAYRILGRLPIPQDSIPGRATTCWRVQDPDTLEVFVVKDSWRPEERIAEHELLGLVKGLPGVVQMVSYEAERGETKDFRCPKTLGQYHNRIAARVMMRSYGESIQCFKSVHQLICALRDAIAGHQRLTDAGVRILHRDISPNNILLEGEGAVEGDRGVIIDLDLAFKATEEHPTIPVDHNTGTRVFQSLSVLDSSIIDGDKHQYSYLDDLESFLYVLTFIFFTFRPDGSRVPSKDKGAAIIPQWNHFDPEWAACNKRGLFGFGEDWHITLKVVEPHWGHTCFKLFEQFHDWTLKIVEEKDTLLYLTDYEEGSDPFESLHIHREEQYAAILKMFDDAIGALQLKSSAPQPISNSTPCSAPVLQASVVDEECDIPNLTAPNTAADETPASLHVPVSHPPPLLPTLDHGAPSSTTLPTPPGLAPVGPRRPARIRNLHTSGGKPDTSPTTTSLAELPAHATRARRSARIHKRRLEEQEHVEEPKPKARRTIKGHRRVTTRTR